MNHAMQAYCGAKSVISTMMNRTARRRESAPDHLEQQQAHCRPVEMKEFFEPRFVIVRLGSSVKASLGATRKPR